VSLSPSDEEPSSSSDDDEDTTRAPGVNGALSSIFTSDGFSPDPVRK